MFFASTFSVFPEDSRVRKLLLVLCKPRSPRRMPLRAALAHAVSELIVDAVRNQKLRVFRPAVISLHPFDFRFAQRLTLRFVRVLLVRRAVADVAVDNDERWPIVGLEEVFIRAPEHLEIVRIGDVRDVPSVARKARCYVFAERPL